MFIFFLQLIDLSGNSDAMHAKLLQQILKVDPSAEKNRAEDIANMSRNKWPAVAGNINPNHSIEIVEVLDSDNEKDEFDNNLSKR